MKVLLVEDNPGDARLIEEMLREVGTSDFQLTYAQRLSEALQMLDEGTYDLVLLDFGLPDSQGLDTFTKLHAHEPDVPVVALTGLSDESLAVKAVSEGVQDYLVKGRVDSNLLVRAMRYAVERKKSEKRVAVTAELTMILGSSLDLSDIFEVFAEGVKRLVDCDSASIVVAEESEINFIAVSSGSETELSTGTSMPLEGTATAWVMDNKRVNIEDDLAQEKQFPIDDIYAKEGMRSVIRIPLFSQGAVFGTFNMASRQPNAYGKREQELLEDLASRIALTVANDRLFAEVRRRNEELERANKQLQEKTSALVGKEQGAEGDKQPADG